MDALDGLPNKNPQPNTLAELDSCAMAWAEGLEPPTVGLENRCSIQLSYTHIDNLSWSKNSNWQENLITRIKFAV
jgi:hypothetical protein